MRQDYPETWISTPSLDSSRFVRSNHLEKGGPKLLRRRRRNGYSMIRPCVIVSPDELNAHMGAFIVAPMTTGAHAYPFRVLCRFEGKDGHVVIDQLRTVDRQRLVKKLGSLEGKIMSSVLDVLQAMFAP